jgi:hypothetical protein
LSTAIFISGHTRTFGIPAVYDSQRWHVFRQCHDPHFFCSVVDDEQASALDQLTRDYGADHVFIEKIKAQPDCEAEVARLCRWSVESLRARTAHAPYALAPHASPQTIFRSLWHQQRAFQFFHECLPDQAKRDTFSRFIRHRPDLFFHRLEMPRVVLVSDAFLPFWGSYGGINDRFAILGVQAAIRYFNAYSALPRLLREGCPLHPETLSGAALEGPGVIVRPTLIAEFTGVRLPDAAGRCEMVPAVITEQDHFRHRQALASRL